jgi:hypothetical protein
MRKCANISPYMRRPLVIYDFATDPLFYQCIMQFFEEKTSLEYRNDEKNPWLEYWQQLDELLLLAYLDYTP